MSIIDNFTSGFKDKAIASIKIQEFSYTLNSIWEQIKSWSDKYSFTSIFYLKRWLWESEKWDKEVIINYFIARFNISNIWGDVNNINEGMRIEKNWLYYKIDMIDYTFQDHIVLKLILIK